MIPEHSNNQLNGAENNKGTKKDYSNEEQKSSKFVNDSR